MSVVTPLQCLSTCVCVASLILISLNLKYIEVFLTSSKQTEALGCTFKCKVIVQTDSPWMFSSTGRDEC